MKEESENKNTYKAVEEKGTKFGKLIAKKSLKLSSGGTVQVKVEVGQDVSNFPEDKLALLRANGVI